MKRARGSGVAIAYEDLGAGEPLLLVMGLGGTAAHWRGFDERLARGRRVLAFDPRGVGASERAPGPFTMAMLAADALAVLDDAGVARADVLGVSLGGMVAQTVALDAPARVRRVVLGCTSARGDVLADASPDTIAKVNLSGKRAAEAVRDLMEVNLGAAWRAAHPDELEQLVAWSLAQPVPRASIAAQLAALLGHDATARLGEIAHETLVVHGEDDALIACARGRALAAAIPRAELVAMPAVGHCFWMEQLEASAARVESFLDRT